MANTKKQPLYGLREVTTKMYLSFLASERAGLDGIGFNDNWNKEKYGMTMAEASNIRKAMSDLYGMRPFWPKTPNLAALNARIHGTNEFAQP